MASPVNLPLDTVLDASNAPAVTVGNAAHGRGLHRGLITQLYSTALVMNGYSPHPMLTGSFKGPLECQAADMPACDWGNFRNRQLVDGFH